MKGGEFRHRSIRRGSLVLLLFALMAALLAVQLHRLMPQSHLMDRIIPPALLLFFAGQLVYLYLHPRRVEPVLRLTFVMSFFALLLPAWYYPLRAHYLPDENLISMLPPIMPFLFPLVTGFVLFLRPREVGPAIGIACVLIGFPIVLYLLVHPDELLTPRGNDLIMGLLPAIAIVYVMLQFQQRMRSGLGRLEAEASLLKTLAHRDPLTGLYNRRAGEEFLTRLDGTHDKPHGLLLFDVDQFKKINDVHGHAAGDAVLREIARCCEDRLRRQDPLVRWGGEEFLAILTDADEKACKSVAETLRVMISNTSFPGIGIVTASFGICVVRSRESIQDALARADAALYAAKAAGRNRVELAVSAQDDAGTGGAPAASDIPIE